MTAVLYIYCDRPKSSENKSFIEFMKHDKTMTDIIYSYLEDPLRDLRKEIEFLIKIGLEHAKEVASWITSNYIKVILKRHNRIIIQFSTPANKTGLKIKELEENSKTPRSHQRNFLHPLLSTFLAFE